MNRSSKTVLIFLLLISVAGCKTRINSLTRAAAAGDIAGVKALVEKGADVNVKDKEGDSALRLASNGGYKEIVQMLKRAGAV